MATRRIVPYGEPILRQKAKKVHRIDPSIQQLVQDMIETVQAAPGVGLAAPQVGVPLRVIVTWVDDKVNVVLNPEIVEATGADIEGEEGCLSMPGWYGPVMRKERVVVRGLNRKGKPMKIKSDGWEARVFQHEVDHLDGIFFTDRMIDRRKLHQVEPEDEEEEFEAEQNLA